jgi:hypothetical protein
MGKRSYNSHGQDGDVKSTRFLKKDLQKLLHKVTHEFLSLLGMVEGK